MSRIAFLDDSFAFTGATLRQEPLGGIQTATIMLAETLAARGHQVAVHGMGSANEHYNGVLYRPLFTPWEDQPYDLVIANCVAKLFPYVKGKKKALWLHGPARYLRKPRHLWPYLCHRPHVVFQGEYHRGTWPVWMPMFGASLLPHGVGEPFLAATERVVAPEPRAIFASDPRRGLDWILDVWVKHIHPSMPGAKLHAFVGRNPHRSRHNDKIDRILDRIASCADKGVVRHEPRPKEELSRALLDSRVMLYRGDKDEVFCFAAAEAQCSGVPIVTAGLGSLGERVIDGRTGFVRSEEETFASAALQLLRDDALWRRQHVAALETREDLKWTSVAMAWENAFGLE